MKLYEIDEAILACIDGETGEVLDFEQLEQLQVERDKKIEGVALYIKTLKAEAEAIKAEEAALAERRKAKENKAERVKEWLGNVLGGQNFETSKVKMTFRNNPPAVSVTDKQALLAWLEQHSKESCIKYSDPEIVKAEVKKLLAAGETVEGAELTQSQSFTIK